MKKIALLVAALVSITMSAQSRQVKFAISAAPSFPFIAAKQTLVGSGSEEIKIGFNAGISAGFVLANDDELEIGAYFQQNKLKVTAAPNPPFTPQTSERNLQLIFIPVHYKYNFENQFFIKGGPVLDIDTQQEDAYFDNYSGIGFGVSAGKDFGAEGIMFRVAPYANAHTLYSFNDNNNYIIDLGLQLGIVF